MNDEKRQIADEQDTEGHGGKFPLADDDTEGQRFHGGLVADDEAEGHRVSRVAESEDDDKDAEGHHYRGF